MATLQTRTQARPHMVMNELINLNTRHSVCYVMRRIVYFQNVTLYTYKFWQALAKHCTTLVDLGQFSFK